MLHHCQNQCLWRYVVLVLWLLWQAPRIVWLKSGDKAAFSSFIDAKINGTCWVLILGHCDSAHGWRIRTYLVLKGMIAWCFLQVWEHPGTYALWCSLALTFSTTAADAERWKHCLLPHYSELLFVGISPSWGSATPGTHVKWQHIESVSQSGSCDKGF